MGKIQDRLQHLIVDAMKERNQIRKNAYTNLKTAFMQYTTSKEGAKECELNENGDRVISDTKELSIVKKMHDELIVNGNQYDLPDYIKEASYLEEFIPPAASEEDIVAEVLKHIDTSVGIEKKDMGKIIKLVKEDLQNADGKLVATVVQRYVH